jgi:anti-anti-sigma regulatory factor
MLRITRKANGELVLRVSGQLNAESVAEVRALIAAESKGSRIVLDCADLRSADAEAVRFLENCEASSIKLKNCGLYIREWIRRERLERSGANHSSKTAVAAYLIGCVGLSWSQQFRQKLERFGRIQPEGA